MLPDDDRSELRDAVAYLKPVVPTTDPAAVMSLSEADAPVMRDLTPELLVAYLVDAGDSFAYVQGRHLAHTGLSAPALHDIGLRNLQRLADRRLEVRRHGDIFVVLMDGHFEASVILLDKLWDHDFRQCVAGRYAAAFPARDILAFADAASVSARDQLLAVIARIYPSGDHLLSDKVFVRDRGVWHADT